MSEKDTRFANVDSIQTDECRSSADLHVRKIKMMSEEDIGKIFADWDSIQIGE